MPLGLGDALFMCCGSRSGDNGRVSSSSWAQLVPRYCVAVYGTRKSRMETSHGQWVRIVRQSDRQQEMLDQMNHRMRRSYSADEDENGEDGENGGGGVERTLDQIIETLLIQ